MLWRRLGPPRLLLVPQWCAFVLQVQDRGPEAWDPMSPSQAQSLGDLKLGTCNAKAKRDALTDSAQPESPEPPATHQV